jgi:menaquinone-dependent protoporphyrinogen IX oxidase
MRCLYLRGFSIKPITVAYASRFGSTVKLAEQVAAGLHSAGATPKLIDVTADPTVELQPLVILTPIIWDRPIPVMREWITANSALARQCTVACGVVCGSAGMRETGGMVYARQLAKRIGRPDVFQFALSGEIPARNRMRSWEWYALRIFTGVLRKPQLFAVRADASKAKAIGARIGEQICLQLDQ